MTAYYLEVTFSSGSVTRYEVIADSPIHAIQKASRRKYHNSDPVIRGEFTGIRIYSQTPLN